MTLRPLWKVQSGYSVGPRNGKRRKEGKNPMVVAIFPDSLAQMISGGCEGFNFTHLTTVVTDRIKVLYDQGSVHIAWNFPLTEDGHYLPSLSSFLSSTPIFVISFPFKKSSLIFFDLIFFSPSPHAIK